MVPTDPKTEFTVSDIISTLLRHYKLMVIVPTVATAVAGVVAFTLKPEYEARGNLEVGRVLEKPVEEPVAVADRMQSRPFIMKAARGLGWRETSIELRKRVTVNVIYRQPADQEEPTRSVAVTASANDPRKARDLVYAMLMAVVNEHRLAYGKSFDVNDRLAKDLEKDMAQARDEITRGYAQLDALTASGQVSLVEIAFISSYLREKEDFLLRLQDKSLELRRMLYSDVFTKPTSITVTPEIPDASSGPHRARIVVIVFVTSLVVAAALAFFLQRFGGGLANQECGGAPGPGAEAVPRRTRRTVIKRVSGV